MIAIIDYGMGNLRSVANAFETLGAEAKIAAEPGALRDATGIVLPGVGAFGDGMRNLHARGFVEALQAEVLDGGKPFLGLCLGLQLLGTTGLEHGTHAGLGWIPGVVDRLPMPPDLRVPHIGWNDVRIVKTDGLYAGLGEKQVCYFVHSYALRPEDRSVISGVCDYGIEFVASIAREIFTPPNFILRRATKPAWPCCATGGA